MFKIIIDPLSNVLYQSFYIKALYETFGNNNVSFGNEPFRSLSLGARTIWGICFVVSDTSSEKKVFIDAGDFNTINEELYIWSDVYGKVNANVSKTPGKDKMVSLCPSFAVKCWNVFGTIRFAISNMIRYLNENHFTIDMDLKHQLGRYRRLLLRAPLDVVVPGQSENNYVFFCSTLWYNDEYNKNDAGVNLRRANFIRVCKSIVDLRFEGGFVVQQGRSTDCLFDDCLSTQAYTYKEYISKTQKSAVVFNTPAFWDCHGWKLGEYLALGKAIISTPLSNDLPYPLEHGVNIHFVENDISSIKEGVQYVLSHPEYRHHLEKGAYSYWCRWGTPKRNMEILNVTK